VGLRGWVRQQLSGIGVSGINERIDLVEPLDTPISVPRRVGLELQPLVQPWSIARLTSLLSEAANQPSESTLKAARVARHRLSSFWISAPVDHLRQLYEGDLGSLQQLFLESSLFSQDLAQDEQSWVNHLFKLLDDPCEHSRVNNLQLALIPYIKPGQLSIQNPLETIPDWLLPDYIKYCDPDLASELNQPAGLLTPSRESFPPLTTRRGDQAMAWFRDEEVIQQMLSLIESYQQGSESQELLGELAGLRIVLAQLWLDVDPSQLETLIHTSTGDITKSIIKSGFGRILSDEQDQLVRNQLVDRARDFNQPNAPGIILAMLMFYPRELVGFKSTDGLPDWFVSLLVEILG